MIIGDLELMADEGNKYFFEYITSKYFAGSYFISIEDATSYLEVEDKKQLESIMEKTYGDKKS